MSKAFLCRPLRFLDQSAGCCHNNDKSGHSNNNIPRPQESLCRRVGRIRHKIKINFSRTERKMTDASDLENYRIQLQQVEAALLAEPDNDELVKLQSDLTEVIALTEDLVGVKGSSSPVTASTGNKGPTSSKTDASGDKLEWKVGDRCSAPSSNGQSYEAVIDGISQEKVAITFIGNGTKHMVKMGELKTAPTVTKKSYIWDSTKSGGASAQKKNEWQVERERRRARAQKKAQRQKNLEEAKEGEKSRWQNFNAKGLNKNLKGFKRPTASGSAPDGPSGGLSAGAREHRPRQDNSLFQWTRRGNMDSLF